MRIDLTDISSVKKSMAVEIDAAEVTREREAVVRGYASKASIPGFRQGKVPLGVVRSRFAKEIGEEVRERVLSRYYHEATHEKGLRPVGQPIVDEISDEAGQPFRFKTTFEVLPEIELEDYRGVEVRRKRVIVEDAEIEKALEELRQSRVQLVTEEGRKAVTGDVLLVDVTGTPDGGEPFERENMLIEVGAQDNLPAFNERLIDARAEADLEFPVDYPAEYGSPELAGKTVKYRLKVREVKRREVPDLDDEFAKDLGEFDNLDALRKAIGTDLEAKKSHEADGALRQAVLDKVLLSHPIPLPEVLVEDEIRRRLEEFVGQLIRQGMDPEKLDLDWKELRERQTEPARKNVHARLVLDAVSKAESIEVSREEIEERVARDAKALGEKIENVRTRLREGGGMELLSAHMLREKSLDLLLSVANIQSEE